MNKKNLQKIANLLFVGIFLIAPAFVSAAELKLVPCGGEPGDTYTDVSGVQRSADHQCTFNDFMKMINNIIHFLMYDVMIPLAALGFMFTGANLIISQNKESAWSQAKERFGYLGWGIFIIIGSFIVIKFILSQFLSDGFSVTFLLN